MVQGRVLVPGYDRARTQALMQLEQACGILGLVYLTLPPEGESGRRSYARARTPVDEALADLNDHPGIPFLEWAFRNYLTPSQQKTTPMDTAVPLFKAAAARAQVALHRLYHMNRIVKRYNDDGELILFLPHQAPPKAPKP